MKTMLSLSIAVLSAALAHAQTNKSANPLPAPHIRNVKYGPHERNVFDLWLAKSDRPTPLFVYIHGDG